MTVIELRSKEWWSDYHSNTKENQFRYKSIFDLITKYVLNSNDSLVTIATIMS